MDLQTFDVDVARRHGLECAVLFQVIGYWVGHNRSKPDRQRDGKAWMYMSRREWLEEFGYIGEGTLRSSLQKLTQVGLIATGNYSDGMYARTTWYTLTEKGWALWLKQPMGLAESAKGFGEISQTITTTHSTNTDKTENPSVSPQSTKATKRGSIPLTSLDEFLQNSGGEPPFSFRDYPSAVHRWTPEQFQSVWQQFCRYWRSPDAKGSGRKRDWLTTWQNWCDRENSRRGGASGSRTDNGLVAAMRSSVANRYGASPVGDGVSRGSSTGDPHADAGGSSPALAPGEIPY